MRTNHLAVCIWLKNNVWEWADTEAFILVAIDYLHMCRNKTMLDAPAYKWCGEKVWQWLCDIEVMAFGKHRHTFGKGANVRIMFSLTAKAYKLNLKVLNL